MRQVIVLTILIGLFPVNAIASDEALDALMSEYWDYYLAEFPTTASRVGVNDYNDRMPGVSPADYARRLAAEQRFIARVRDIDAESLSDAGRINAELLEWVLRESIEANQLDLSRIPFNTFSGFFMNALTASNGLRMDSRSDFDDYLARLADIPRYFDENIANMRRGSDGGFVLPQIVIDGVLPTLEAQLKDNPEDSSFFQPFKRIPDSLADDQAELEAAGRDVIGEQVLPAFGRLVEFLQTEYSASESLGAEQLPDGKAYYAHQIRRYTTLLDTTSDDIHAIGLAEVARIRKEMDAIIAEVEFDGDFEAFGEFLRTDPQFYAETPEDLLKEAAWIAKRIDYLMPAYFGYLPRQSYGIVPVPDEIAPNYTTGAYYGAPLSAMNGGAFWINTHGLDQRPLYELPALTLHEGVPGHHHSNAIALELENVPALRRSLGIQRIRGGLGTLHGEARR